MSADANMNDNHLANNAVVLTIYDTALSKHYTDYCATQETFQKKVSAVASACNDATTTWATQIENLQIIHGSNNVDLPTQ